MEEQRTHRQAEDGGGVYIAAPPLLWMVWWRREGRNRITSGSNSSCCCWWCCGWEGRSWIISYNLKLSENLTIQNPLHMKRACNTSISNAYSHQMVWYGRRWAVYSKGLCMLKISSTGMFSTHLLILMQSQSSSPIIGFISSSVTIVSSDILRYLSFLKDTK